MGKKTGSGFWLSRVLGLHKSWHLVATLFVAISFPFIFCDASRLFQNIDATSKMAYYIIFIGTQCLIAIFSYSLSDTLIYSNLSTCLGSHSNHSLVNDSHKDKQPCRKKWPDSYAVLWDCVSKCYCHFMVCFAFEWRRGNVR